jgi:SAM-dependent methyltransferase
MTPRIAGALKIVRFNMRFYVGSMLGLTAVVVLLCSGWLPRWMQVLGASGAALLAFWTVSSLAVSWYVYDCARVTEWAWIPARMMVLPQRWVNIHAGLDESSAALREWFPGATGCVVDIYDPVQMTEPSIARARRMFPATEPIVEGRFDSLPLLTGEWDTAFLLFAAHEVRSAAGRTKLLREVARILCDGGQVLLVEHLRNWKNFVAFGPGFLHFHSEQSWKRSIRDAGLRVECGSPVTPFVRCFVLRKQGA